MITEVDLHGYYPGDIQNGLLTRIVQQAWEMGADELVLIHGHGHNAARDLDHCFRLVALKRCLRASDNSGGASCELLQSPSGDLALARVVKFN